jgi:tetratricopeptide (TPR) repeat protein
MTGTKAPEYRALQNESSSQLLDYDSRWVLGRYEEAAYHALQAGTGRYRMGHLCFQAGEYQEAVEDWLSAAECFLLATAQGQAGKILNILHRLETEGKIPAERPDLLSALGERQKRLEDLNRKVQQFLRDLGAQSHLLQGTDEPTLRFLLEHVRKLPGFPLLHYAIFRQASDLGQQDVAAKHLVWAATFDPNNANLAALLGYLHLSRGKPDRAVELGNDFLTTHSSETGPVRIMLANALALGGGERPPDQEGALEVLRPLVEEAEADQRERIAALALSATFEYEMGHEQKFGHLIKKLARLEDSIQAPELRGAIAEFRAIIPQPPVKGAGEARPGPRLLPEVDRWRLFQKAKEVSIRHPSLAA